MQQEEIRKLITYIEENLRSSNKAGLQFVDSRNFNTQLISKQNHVVFGRRGAGKTSLLKSVCGYSKYIDIYINLEDYKDITFPNILISVLYETFVALSEKIRHDFPWYKFNRKANSILKTIKMINSQLKPYLYQPDEETKEVRTKEATIKNAEIGAKKYGLDAGLAQSDLATKEVKRNLPWNKLEFLKVELTVYKKLIKDISLLFSNTPIFLVLDDFYFVDKKVQPDLVDYFHRLCKDTELYLKIATIKYRSKLYRRTNNQYTGVEIGHDILGIDMDYTLDNFDALKQFMHNLLDNAISYSKTKVVFNDVFEGEGFSQLCLASGGVPRDFLSLFVSLGNTLLVSGAKIGKVEVTQSAIKSISTKYDSMKRDSSNDSACLEEYLEHIIKFVFNEKRTNCFLISKDELDSQPEFKQAIRELVDLRLIHLVDDNTSKAPSDGKRYEAYIIDVGLYDNPRPRDFFQIEPGKRDEKSRSDALRASPVVSFAKVSVQPVPKNCKDNGNRKTVKKVAECQSRLSLSFE